MTPATRVSFLPVALFVLAVNFLAMPADLYVGDPNAPRKEAIHLLNTGEWGIPFDQRGALGDLAAQKGQYFWENAGKGRFFSKYGPLNTLLSLPPLAVEKLFQGELPFTGTSRSLLFLLNVYNVLLSLLLAFLLHRLFADDGPASWIPSFLVLSCFYGTFLWHYLRAQTMEIFQVISFTGFLGCYFRRLRGGPRGDLLGAAAWLSALVFLKFSYLLLFPVVALHPWVSAPERRRESALFLWLPLLAAAALLGVAHRARFGGFFESGYGQWAGADGGPHDRFSPAMVLTGLAGFLFSPSRGLLFHFPLLAASVAGFPSFYRRRPREALFLGGVFLLFLFVLSGLSNWAGEACYGPRYFLFLLPGICLPAAEGFRWIAARRRSLVGGAGAGLLAAALLFSARLQVYVNGRPFFFFYEVSGPFRSYGIADIDRYFDGRPFGLVNRDVGIFLRGEGPFYPLERLSASLPVGKREEESARVGTRLRELAEPNYFWFPRKND